MHQYLNTVAFAIEYGRSFAPEVRTERSPSGAFNDGDRPLNVPDLTGDLEPDPVEPDPRDPRVLRQSLGWSRRLSKNPGIFAEQTVI